MPATVINGGEQVQHIDSARPLRRTPGDRDRILAAARDAFVDGDPPWRWTTSPAGPVPDRDAVPPLPDREA